MTGPGSTNILITGGAGYIGSHMVYALLDRGEGDPPELVADPSRLKTQFNWSPKHMDLEEIVATAYAWEKRLNAV